MDDTRQISDDTVKLQRSIERLQAGDATVRGELLNLACGQLERLMHELKSEFDQVDQTGLLDRPSEELLESIAGRLYEALHDVSVRDERHFYQIASRQIRRELIDLCGRGGLAGSDDLSQLARFHHSVDSLPETEREVFELIHYHQRSREAVAEMLGIGLNEVKRLWRSARLRLHELLDE